MFVLEINLDLEIIPHNKNYYCFNTLSIQTVT